MRTTVSACVWLLLLGSSLACSSKSTGGAAGGSGGGAILTAGSGGTSSNTGGSASNNGGSATAQAGSGGAADACANAPIVCTDAMSASTCDPVTGKDMTFNCVTEAQALGFTSGGCTKDPDTGEDGCTIESFNDAECEAGTAPWGVCQGFTSDQAIDIYVACYQDTNGLQAPIKCYAKYYDEAAKMLDCVGAAAECDMLQTM